MSILAFDTATRATAVALDGTELRDDPPPGVRPRHTSRLMPLIAELLDQTGTSWSQIERIAVGTGPGTFTGLRIGVASARALARARRIPLVGVSTLESLALTAVSRREPGSRERQKHERPEVVLAVLDARRGEVFAAGWGVGEAGAAFDTPLLRPAALDPGALAEAAAELAGPALAIGDGAVEFRTVLERSGAVIPDDGSSLHRVTAVGHVERARVLSACDPAAVLPQYIRLPDAELARSASRKP